MVSAPNPNIYFGSRGNKGDDEAGKVQGDVDRDKIEIIVEACDDGVQ